MAETGIDKLIIELQAQDKATKEIDKLSKSIKGLGDSLTRNISKSTYKSVADSMKTLGSAIRELDQSANAVNNIPKLTTALSDMMGTLAQAPKVSKDVLELATALSKISTKSMKEFNKAINPSKGDSGSGMQAISEQARQVTSQTEKATVQMRSFGGALRGALANLPNVAQKISKLDFSKITGGFKKLLSVLGNLTKRFIHLSVASRLFHKANNISFKKGFTTVLRYAFGIRSLFVLFNRIRSAIEDGNKNLAKYSATFNKSMSLYKSGLGTLKNAMSVAFAPLVNYFSAAVNKILDNFINAFNTIARLLAKLTGAKQVVQATRYYNDFADSLGSASKNAKDLTTGIDELNILNADTGGGGGGANVQDMFETVDVDGEFNSLLSQLKDSWEKADFYDFGKSLADKINEKLQSIDWVTIKKNAAKAGKSLATFLNGVFEEEFNGQSFGTTVGTTIGEGINTAIEFAYAFVKNFHYDSFGKFIRDGLKGAIETIEWYKLGNTISTHITGLLTTISEIVKDKQLWIDIGNAIKDAFKGFVDNLDLGLAGKDFSDAINGFMTALTIAFSDTQTWQKLGTEIGSFFSNIDWKATWFNFKELAKTVLLAIKNALISWAQTDDASLKVAAGVGAAIMALNTAKLIAALNGATLAKVIGGAIVGAIKNAGGISFIDFGFSAMIGEAIGNALSGKDLAGKALPQEGETSAERYLRQAEETYKKGKELSEKYGKLGFIFNTEAYSAANTFDTLDEYLDSLGISVDKTTGEVTLFNNELKDTKSKTDGIIKTDFNNYNKSIEDSTKKQSLWNGAIGNTVVAIGDQEDWVKTASASVSDVYCGSLDTGKTETQSFSDTVKQTWENLKNDTSANWENIKTDLGTKWENIKTDGSTKFQTLKDDVLQKWEETKTKTSAKWEETKRNLVAKWGNIKEDSKTKFQEIKDDILKKWDDTKTKTSTKWKTIQDNLSKKWSELVNTSDISFEDIKNNIVDAFKEAGKGIKKPINDIIGFVEGMVNKLIDGFNTVSDTIKEFTTFNFTNPFTGETTSSGGLRLPKAAHVKIPRLADGGFIPNNSMGSLFVAGENGAEIIANASGGTEVLNATQVADAVSGGVRQAIVDAVLPYMVQLVNSNQAIAEKDLSVNIGDRDIAKANRRGESQLGLQLITG